MKCVQDFVSFFDWAMLNIDSLWEYNSLADFNFSVPFRAKTHSVCLGFLFFCVWVFCCCLYLWKIAAMAWATHRGLTHSLIPHSQQIIPILLFFPHASRKGVVGIAVHLTSVLLCCGGSRVAERPALCKHIFRANSVLLPVSFHSPKFPAIKSQKTFLWELLGVGGRHY